MITLAWQILLPIILGFVAFYALVLFSNLLIRSTLAIRFLKSVSLKI
jgi:hypothetical protein